MTPLLLAIDATNWAHRLHRAAGARAAHLFGQRIDALVKHYASQRPVKVVCAFDTQDKAACFRRRLDPAYKAKRPETPTELRQAIADCSAWCIDHEIDVASCRGYEADDCLATIAHHFAWPNATTANLPSVRETSQTFQVLIASSDKDLRQLLAKNRVTQLLDVRVDRGKPTCTYMTAGTMLIRLGLQPCQWIDYQCLVGDSGDGIVGCPGIGSKTASGILQSAGTIANALADPWRHLPTAKLRDGLLAFAKSGRLDIVRQLVTLRRDVPLPICQEALR